MAPLCLLGQVCGGGVILSPEQVGTLKPIFPVVFSAFCKMAFTEADTAVRFSEQCGHVPVPVVYEV